MADPGKYRTQEEVDKWKARDPIVALGQKLDTLGMKERREQIEARIEQEIVDAVKFGEDSPFPAPETACNYVYK